MPGRRVSIRRELTKNAFQDGKGVQTLRYAVPRRVRNTNIDFASLGLPVNAAEALAEAFWNHVGVQSDRNVITHWSNLKIFGRFVREQGTVAVLEDLDGIFLGQYVDWLNRQCKPDGRPWTKSGRAGAYTILRKLLQWIERCRPGLIKSIAYPFNPFPWRNRDTPSREQLSSSELRRLLAACEADISQMRTIRQATKSPESTEPLPVGSLNWLLRQIDSKFGGIVPPASELAEAGNHPIASALKRHGGLKGVEPHLYPRGEVLLPYYLAILIHTAGNPDPIVELGRDCLQSLPLLENRQAVVWFKARAASTQRRTFNSQHGLQPPSLVREILAWNERLVSRAPTAIQERLFLYIGRGHVTAMTSSAAKHLLPGFCKRHNLPRFALASIRPSVLTSFYRANGDLRHVSQVANHAHLSTTVRYVMTPQVQEQNRTRIAALQNAFIGHIRSPKQKETSERHIQRGTPSPTPSGQLVSLFGFDCEDPYAGVAPGTQRGRLCNNFMGCFTCPNAVITAEPANIARLLQARAHLRDAAATLHPARWAAFYEPQLRILEEDVLTRFSAAELKKAMPLLAGLVPLPELR